MNEAVFLGPKMAADGVVKLLGAGSASKIIDVGAGTGKVANYVSVDQYLVLLFIFGV